MRSWLRLNEATEGCSKPPGEAAHREDPLALSLSSRDGADSLSDETTLMRFP